MKSFVEHSSKMDICPNCEEEREIKVGVKDESLVINKETVEFKAQVKFCTFCGEYFADMESEEKNIQTAYQIYRQKYGLLSPDEIRQLRVKYGLSQRAFSRLLGWGDITFHRYESGGLQDKAHNNELLLVKDPENFLVLFDANKDRLPTHMVDQIEKRRNDLLNEHFNTHTLIDFMRYRNVDIYSGFRLFDEEKFQNCVLFFAKNLNLFKTKLNKLLWYSDFLHFKHYNSSITGSVYVHAPYGPIPDGYEFFIAGMLKNRLIELEEVTFSVKEDIVGERIIALEEPDTSFFSVDENACLATTVDLLGKLSAKKISDLSHEEAGYKNTLDLEKISYDWAKDLEIALQSVE